MNYIVDDRGIVGILFHYEDRSEEAFKMKTALQEDRLFFDMKSISSMFFSVDYKSSISSKVLYLRLFKSFLLFCLYGPQLAAPTYCQSESMQFCFYNSFNF